MTKTELPKPSRVIPVAYFTKDTTVTESDYVWKKKTVAVPPIPPDNEEIKKQWFECDGLELYDISDVFTTYDHNTHRAKRILFTHVAGGIGDVLAFSAVAEFLRNKTLIAHTDPHFFPLFKWFSNQDVRTRGFYDAIAKEYTPTNRLTKYNTYARLRLEYSAIDGGQNNWFDSMFQRIGLKEAPAGFKRPRLVRRTDTFSIVPKTKSIIICHRSSCQMRSSKFEDFWFPVRSAYPDHMIFVHDSDLTEQDRKFIEDIANEVIILPKTDLDGFLSNLYHASLVVSTDSSAIHFREGVQKPAIGVFGAMTKESRTDGYIYTHSFNTSVPCPHKPCFLHEFNKGDRCLNSNESDTFARCQSGTDFQVQLAQELTKFRY